MRERDSREYPQYKRQATSSSMSRSFVSRQRKREEKKQGAKEEDSVFLEDAHRFIGLTCVECKRKSTVCLFLEIFSSPLRFYIFHGRRLRDVGLNIIKSNRGRGASLDSNRYKRRIQRRAGDSRRTNFAEHERLAGTNDNIGYVLRGLRGGVPPRLERKERLVPVRGVDRNKRKRFPIFLSFR